MKIRLGNPNVALAKSNARAKRVIEFSKNVQSYAYRRLLEKFIQAVKPEIADRFKDPEVDIKPHVRGDGGYCYSLYSGFKNYELLVETIDSPSEITVRLHVRIFNPFNDREERLVNVEVRETTSPEEFNKNNKLMVKKLMFNTSKQFKEQMSAEQPRLQAQAESLMQQAKFIKSLLDSFLATPEVKVDESSKVAAKKRKR